MSAFGDTDCTVCGTELPATGVTAHWSADKEIVAWTCSTACTDVYQDHHVPPQFQAPAGSLGEALDQRE